MRKIIYYAHWVLFFLFVGTGFAAFAAWWLYDSLESAAVIATAAALVATVSAFLERLFPKDR